MIDNEVAIGVILLLSIVYFVLGFLAYSSIEHKEGAWGLNFVIWFVDKDKFNQLGKNLCPLGKILFISILAAVVLIFSA